MCYTRDCMSWPARDGRCRSVLARYTITISAGLVALFLSSPIVSNPTPGHSSSIPLRSRATKKITQDAVLTQSTPGIVERLASEG